MNFGEFRKQMETFRNSVDKEARALKDSQLALTWLYDFYRKLDVSERSMADRVLIAWALSQDENLRFDALALIDEYKVTAAIPALWSLAERLGSSSTPGAPYELQKVNRILLGLGTGPHSGHG
jgi:hypothetical protein